MEEPNLYEIRYPFQRLSKNDGKLYLCNSMCAKLTAGSSGELRCRKCRLNFWCEISDEAQQQTGVKVKRVEQLTQKEEKTK